MHVRKLRNVPKSRDYRKLHLWVDELTGEVIASDLTSKAAGGPSRVEGLISQLQRPIASARADGGYDVSDVYEAIENHRRERSPRVLIPPRKRAQLAAPSPTTRERNRNIRARARLGKRAWHVQSGYSTRTKVETAFTATRPSSDPRCGRGDRGRRGVEARVGCRILNVMTRLGMPDGVMLG